MIANDTRPQPHDIMARSFPVLPGEAVDRYRGQWAEGHISQALGYSSLVVGSLGTHAVLFENLKTSFALADADLGGDPLVYGAPRLGSSVSILDAVTFYGRMLQRNSPTGAFGSGQSNGEDRAYWCSPELTLRSPSVCDASTAEKQAALEAQQTFTKQHYTIYAPLIARGAARNAALRSASSTLFYNCKNKVETKLGKSLVRAAQGSLRDRVWPLHPLFWRPLTHDNCALSRGG
jgi:hypothetical protein